jgi:uncharacterized protein (TIGR00725 family)
VVGASDASAEESRFAEAVGRLLAEAGAVVVCGGRGGVMEAACRGVADGGGVSVGILPGRSRRDANPYVTVAVATGLGEARNALVASAGDVLIAVGGAYGTLSEISLALAAGKPVVGLGSWDIDGVVRVDSPEEAVRRALELAA